MTTEEIKKLITTLPEYTVYNMQLPHEMTFDRTRLCNKFNTELLTEDEQMDLFRELFAECGPFMVISKGFNCDYGFNIHFKGFAVINYNCTILDTSPVYLGNKIHIGPNVTISCVGHSIDPEQREKSVTTSKSITIGDGVWIGANVVVCPGVTIGDNAVIGAGSVVTKDIPANCVAYGSPCKVVREINESDIIPESEFLKLD